MSKSSKKNVSKSADSYINSKIDHMKNILGIETAAGRYGGACPKWMTEIRESDEQRISSRIRRKRNVQDIEFDRNGKLVEVFA